MSDIEIRNARSADVDAIRQLEERVWPNFSASKEMIASRIAVFPEGSFIAVDKRNNAVVGYLCTMFLGYESSEFPHQWKEITGNGLIQNHDPSGKYVYGVTLTVDSGYVVGMQLQVYGWSVIVGHGRRGCFLGARIPDFAAYKKKYPDVSVEDYVFQKKRKNGNPVDRELAYYFRAGFAPVKVLKDYEPDPESLDYGVLVYSKNPFYHWPFPSLWGWLIKKIGFKLLKMFDT
ncbi:MAG: hypothetical protein KGH93_03400 [Patescibacteria group bacterium]|nr:hypothetical protein [Patescibacteria group bacterium]